MKINLLAIIGMMVAVATVAFTAPKEANTLATSFTYLGPDLEESNVTDPDNWTTSSSQTCNGFVTPCEVEIDEPGVTDIPSLISHLTSMDESEAAQLLEDSAISRKN